MVENIIRTKGERMKKVEVKKLWNGRVSLRDYIVDDALSKQQGIRVKYKDEMMMLSPGQLEKKFSMTECVSRYNGKKYKLYDYVWNPVDKNQRELI